MAFGTGIFGAMKWVYIDGFSKLSDLNYLLYSSIDITSGSCIDIGIQPGNLKWILSLIINNTESFTVTQVATSILFTHGDSAT